MIKINKFIEHEYYYEMIIDSPKNGIFNIKIDKEDYEKIRIYPWAISKVRMTSGIYLYYASSCAANKIYGTGLLHRIVMNAPLDKDVDHINGDTCDDRKFNLRFCVQEQNSRNSRTRTNNKSGHKGVCWDKSCNKWMAYIMSNYTHHTLGYFDDINDAVKCREDAEKKYFGEFRRVS